MENFTLTHRVVGAIVLLSIGIIFIPAMLETDRFKLGNLKESPIPEVPEEIATIVFQLNEDTGKFEQSGFEASEKFSEQIDAEIRNITRETEPGAKTELPKTTGQSSTSNSNTVEKQSGRTWFLQLASFKDQNKAIALRNKLRKDGYVTHISDRKLESGQTLWRVRVGPEMKKSAIVESQKVIEKKFKLKGLIIQRR